MYEVQMQSTVNNAGLQQRYIRVSHIKFLSQLSRAKCAAIGAALLQCIICLGLKKLDHCSNSSVQR